MLFRNISEYPNGDYNILNTTFMSNEKQIISEHRHANLTAEDISSIELFHILLPSMVYVILLMTIGIIGNSLVCYIFYKKWKRRRKPSTLFIICLSWIDLTNCLSTLPFDLVLLLNFFSFDYPVICKISRWLTYSLNCASSVVLLGIATDRLIGIRYSFTRKPFSIYRAKCIIVASFVVAIVTCWPAILLYGTSTDTYTHNITTRSCNIDDEYKHTPYIRWFVFYLLFSNIVYDTVLVAMYSLIGLTIYQQKHRQSDFENSLMYDRRRESSVSLASVESERLKVKLKVHKYFLTSSGSNPKFFECPSKSKQESKCFENKQIDTQLEISPKKESTVKYLPLNRKVNTCSSLHSDTIPVAGPSSSPMVPKRPYTTRAIIFAGGGKRFGPSFHTKKTTFMLFIVTLVYVLTFVPYCTIAVLRTTRGNTFYLMASTLGQNFYQLFLRSYMLSMATNPIIYCFLNKFFRRECIVIIKKGVTCLTK